MDPNQDRAIQAAFDGYVSREELNEALADQRRHLGAEHDKTIAELKRVREVAAAEITRLTAERDGLREKITNAMQRLNESGTGEMGLIDTIHSTHAILHGALELKCPYFIERT